MRTFLIAGAVLGVVISSPVAAQEPIPPIVSKGLQALQEQRCQDAFDVWTGDWLSPRESERRRRLIGSCDFLSEVGAALHGYDLFRVESLTPHLFRIYVVLRYERRPMYLMLSAYAPVDGAWRVTGINWDRDPDKVFPLTILAPEMPGPPQP